MKMKPYIFRKVLHMIACSITALILMKMKTWTHVIYASLTAIVLIYPLLDHFEKYPAYRRFFVEKGPGEVNGHKTEQLIGFCETFMENFTGNPAASVPAGLTEAGLPVGMQIIGRKFRDEDVLAAAYAFEQIMPWSYEIPWGRDLKDSLADTPL